MSDQPTPQRQLESAIARIAILEGMCSATLGLYLANTRNDPTGEKSLALIAAFREDVLAGIAHLPPHMRVEGEKYLDNLVGRVRAMIPGLHAPVTPTNQ